MALTATQDITVAAARRGISIRAADANLAELTEWSEKLFEKMPLCRKSIDAESDFCQCASAKIEISRDRLAFRHFAGDDRRTLNDAYGQRKSRSISPAQHLWLIWRSRRSCRAQFASLDRLYVNRRCNRGGGYRFPRSYRRARQVGPLSVDAPGAVSGGHPIVHFRAGVALGQSGQRNQTKPCEHRHARLGRRLIHGQSQAFQTS